MLSGTSTTATGRISPTLKLPTKRFLKLTSSRASPTTGTRPVSLTTRSRNTTLSSTPTPDARTASSLSTRMTSQEITNTPCIRILSGAHSLPMPSKMPLEVMFSISTTTMTGAGTHSVGISHLVCQFWTLSDSTSGLSGLVILSPMVVSGPDLDGRRINGGHAREASGASSMLLSKE